MTSTSQSDFWTAAAPALGNHLWQSTVFAAVAGLLTVLLRKNRAGARYWLWLIASVKFLLPFSLLVSLGNYLSPVSNTGPNSDFYLAIDTVSQPFPHTVPTMAQPAPVSFGQNLAHMLPAILFLVWLIGFLVVLFTWFLRWRRISSAMRVAVPLHEGREVEALRRMELAGGVSRRIKFLLSSSSLEPGIFGVARPVLIWPEGISGRLGDDHLEAILAHEVWHVRRKDNLAAALHMLVEAIFWFHPLVWWMGARLVEERERACDEEVLQLGKPPQLYAESILKICEFCVGSPLACVAGVTGADLKKRIVYIMNSRIARKLDFARKLLLTALGLIAIALPVIFGLVKPSQSRAESASQASGRAGEYQDVSVTPGQPTTGGLIQTRLLFTPDGMSAKNLGLRMLVREAYGLKSDDQISGVPDSLSNATFNIEARIDPTTKAERKKLNPEQAKLDRQRMFQTLLADQFKLVVHHETKPVPALALVIATNGPKLHQATPGDTYPNGIKGADGESPAGAHKMDMKPGRLIMQALPLSDLANLLSLQTDKPVIDKTNLSGDYDVDLHWPTRDEARKADLKHVAVAKDGAKKVMFMSSGPEFTASISAAIEEQLGLRLDPQNLPLDVIVIDRAEKLVGSQSQHQTQETGGIESAMIKPNLTGEAMPPFKIVSNPPGKGVGVMFSDKEFRATNITLHMLLRHAYGLQEGQIAGGPDWFNSDRFDVDVKFNESPLVEGAGGDVRGLRRLSLQSLLNDRFKLTVHQESRNLPVYVLTVDSDHPKLQEAKPGDTYPNGVKRSTDGHEQGPGLWGPGGGQLVGQGVPIQYLLPVLSEKLGGGVILDKTGLTGKYDFKLQIPAEGASFPAALSTAVQDQLGLKLIERTAPMEVLLVDRAEKPQTN